MSNTISKVDDTNNKKVINVSKNFKIRRDTMNYIVQQYVTVNPSRSPKVDSESEVESRNVWKDVGYYSLNPSGLKSALKNIAILSAESEAEDGIHIREYLKMLKDFTVTIDKSVEVE